MTVKVRPGPSAGNKPKGEARGPASDVRPEASKRPGGRPRKWGSDAERSKARRAAETLRTALDRDPTLAPKLLALARSGGLLRGRPETPDPQEDADERDGAPTPETTKAIDTDAPAAVTLPTMTEATWPDAENLLQQAYFAFLILSGPDLSGHERDPCAGAVARILWELLLALSGAFPELEPLAVVVSVLSLARRGRPGSPTRDDDAWRIGRDGQRVPVPPDDLDFVDRCLRAAFSFVVGAENVYERRAPSPSDPGPIRAWQKWRNELAARLERVEKAPPRAKRLAFLHAINFAAPLDNYWRHKGHQAPIERYVAHFMRSNDVFASRHVTRKMAHDCVEAWRKKKGQRGKWEVLAKACNDLGLGEITSRNLRIEYWTAVKAGEAQPPREVSPEAQDAANRAAREFAAGKGIPPATCR